MVAQLQVNPSTDKLTPLVGSGTVGQRLYTTPKKRTCPPGGFGPIPKLATKLTAV